jgi:hypothetical protein
VNLKVTVAWLPGAIVKGTVSSLGRVALTVPRASERFNGPAVTIFGWMTEIAPKARERDRGLTVISRAEATELEPRETLSDRGPVVTTGPREPPSTSIIAAEA